MTGLIHRLYQRRAWDFTGVADVEHRKILQGALDACDYSFYRIRKNTGKRVPVAVRDLSRFNATLANSSHAHVHENGETGHLLGSEGPSFRRQVLGLFWLPTRAYPAGRVEVDVGCFNDPDLAREVFLAEGAHAVDYGAMTPTQRAQIAAAYHDEPDEQGHASDWFDEGGEQVYWNWAGEAFMEGFTRAFAPSLPTPLAERQEFTHETTPEIAATIRRVLL